MNLRVFSLTMIPNSMKNQLRLKITEFQICYFLLHFLSLKASIHHALVDILTKLKMPQEASEILEECKTTQAFMKEVNSAIQKYAKS